MYFFLYERDGRLEMLDKELGSRVLNSLVFQTIEGSVSGE